VIRRGVHDRHKVRQVIAVEPRRLPAHVGETERLRRVERAVALAYQELHLSSGEAAHHDIELLVAVEVGDGKRQRCAVLKHRSRLPRAEHDRLGVAACKRTNRGQ